jgi:hypothetical protein
LIEYGAGCHFAAFQVCYECGLADFALLFQRRFQFVYELLLGNVEAAEPDAGGGSGGEAFLGLLCDD